MKRGLKGMASIQHTLSECQSSAIRQLEADLIKVLEHEIDVVITKAWSVDIIGEQVRGLGQTTGLTDRFKAEKFVAVVRARVTTDPNTFGSFLSILRSSPSLGPLADRLEEKICYSHRMMQSAGTFTHDSSTPGSPHQTNHQPHHVCDREHSPADSTNATKPRRRKPKKRPRSTDSPTTTASVCQTGLSDMPKLETRNDTDEESGFLDGDTVASVTIDSNGDSGDDDIEENSSFVTSTGGPPFSTPVNESNAATDYKSFADETVGDSELQKQHARDSSNEPIYRESEGIQEMEHGTASQRQVVGGAQPSSNWAEMAHYCIDKGAEERSQLMNDIESLKNNISKLQDLMEKRSEEKRQLNDCRQKLADKEQQLKELSEKRTSDIREAEEKLKREKEDHEAKINSAENEIESLKKKLESKTHEAEQLRQQSLKVQEEYDELKCISEKTIQDLQKQLSDKTEAATRLKEDFNKLEKEHELKLAALKENYDKQISDLERTVVLERELATQKQETLSYKMKAEHLEKEKDHLKENNDLQLKIKDLENELAMKREKIAVLQREEQKKKHEETEAQYKIERQQSVVKLQEMQKERDQYKVLVRRMSSNSSTGSCNSTVSRSNTADKDTDELDAISEEIEGGLCISKSPDSESDSDDSFYSCSSQL